MAAALVCHPSVGSVWLRNAVVQDGYVVGEVLDTSTVGSSYLPDDYRGEYVLMNFPVSCVRKWEEG